ncbi:epoxyqueuosine reductase QueH [Candidatus Woesearchaeota archaeon]|nr:epoxyqueuosine reductase QueH [Candidatus Woesearchaeota archaeon]
MNKKLLLHACCGPCATHCVSELKQQEYDITMYFFNPNIHPFGEYTRRFSEAQRVADEFEVPFVEEEYDIDSWLEMIKGFENEKEGGSRCRLCFVMRLEQAARYAKENGFSCFTTTMTISPHKDSEKINEIGERMAQKYGVEWVHSDFKEDNGFQKSVEHSNRLGLYRQKYCGCFYSVRQD